MLEDGCLNATVTALNSQTSATYSLSGTTEVFSVGTFTVTQYCDTVVYEYVVPEVLRDVVAGEVTGNGFSVGSGDLSLVGVYGLSVTPTVGGVV